MRRLTAALLLLIPLAACDLPTTISPERDDTLTGTLDGQPWAATATSSVYRDTTYIGSGQRVSGGAVQRIIVVVVANGQGGYSVVPGGTRPSGSRYAEVVGGDVVSYWAGVTEGTITVTEYSATRVRGSLQLTFSGSRGVWQFSGQFSAPRQDVP